MDGSLDSKTLIFKLTLVAHMSKKLHLPKNLLNNEYVWAAVGFGLNLGAGVFLAAVVHLSLSESVIILIVTDILLLQWRHYHVFSTQTVASKKEQARLFYKRDETLREAETTLSHASSQINTMWTQMPLDAELKAYFGRTLSQASGKKIHTTRLIDITSVPIDQILEHIDDAWSFLENLSYKIVLIAGAPFEMIYTDPSVGEGVFFQTPKKSEEVTLTIACSETEFYGKLCQMFQSIIESGSREFRTTDFPGHDRNKIEVWLLKMEEELTQKG